MRTRSVREDDLPTLKEIYDTAGYKFDWPDLLSDEFLSVEVVVDERDRPLMAAAAKKSVELFLICAPGGNLHPAMKMKAIWLLHLALRDALTLLGFYEATAFLPPELEKNYGRHLQRKFSWLPTWKAFCIKDWKRHDSEQLDYPRHVP